MRQATGLPAGAVVYSDTGKEEAVLEPLVSHRFGLVGKPDYLVEITGASPVQGRRIVVPLEVKSRRRPRAADPGHVLQLAAYCLLVEDQYGCRPPHGYIRYADATVEVPYTNELRSAVLAAMQAMRKERRAADVPRSHQDAERCRRCGYLAGCGAEALAAAPPAALPTAPTPSKDAGNTRASH